MTPSNALDTSTDFSLSPNTAALLNKYSGLAEATHKLFSGNQSVDLTPYLYSYPDKRIANDPVNGAKIWQKFLNEAEGYYLCDEETELLHASLEDMAKIIPQQATVIELGPGPIGSVQSKTLPFLQSLNKPKGYICIDQCKEYVDATITCIETQMPRLPAGGFHMNFYNNLPFQTTADRQVALFLGNTIANIPELEHTRSYPNTIKKLKKIRSILNTGGLFIIGHDSNQEQASLLEAYDNHLLKQYMLNIFHLMKRELPITGLNPEEFEMEIRWHQNSHSLAAYSKAMSDQHIQLHEQYYHIKKGQKLRTLSSYKYPEHIFKSMAQKAGFQTLKTYNHPKKRMAIHVLQAVQLPNTS